MLTKKPPSLPLLISLLALIFLPLIGIAFWVANNQEETDLDLEIIETDNNPITDIAKDNNELDKNLENIDFTYSETEKIITYSGSIMLTNGCQSLEEHTLRPLNKQFFVLDIKILDPSLDGVMCTQEIKNTEISGSLEFEFSDDFEIKDFSNDLFNIKKTIVSEL